MLWSKLRMARHWLASVRGESKLKVAFVSISVFFLWLGAFGFSWIVLWIFESFGDGLFGDTGDVNISDILLNRLLSLFALTIFVLLVVSNVLVSFATIYRSKEVSYLIQAPLPVATFFLGRFSECLSFSSWALAFLGSPALIAYGLDRGAELPYYFGLVAFFVPFVTIPAAIGSTLTIVLVRVFSGLRRGAVIAVALVGLVFLFGALRARVGNPELDQAASIQAVADILGQTQSPFLPSYWLAEGLLRAAAGELRSSAFYLLLLVANALLFLWLATVAAELWFYRGWASLMASDELRGPGTARGPLRWLDSLLRPLREPLRSLVVKDIKLFWRDPAQWTQFLIFFGVMTLYVANIRNTGGLFAEEPFRSWIAILNMTATMLILATLTTRFIFPLMSLEGRRFWILGLAPLSIRGLIRQKFWLSVGSTSIFTISLAVISGWRLRLEPFEFFLTIFGIGVVTFALSGLAVGLGSLYPNFEEDNPSRITSGMGGTLNFILSLAFIVMVTAGQTFIVNWRQAVGVTDGGRRWVVIGVLGVIVVATALASWVPLRLGLRNLERTEF